MIGRSKRVCISAISALTSSARSPKAPVIDVVPFTTKRQLDASFAAPASCTTICSSACPIIFAICPITISFIFAIKTPSQLRMIIKYILKIKL